METENKDSDALLMQDILMSDNILDLLPEEEINEIAERVFEGYQEDLNSRGEWNENVDKWTLLASQYMEAKNTPWPNASNIKYPLVTEAGIQFSSRMYPATIPNNSPAKGRVIGYDPDGSKLERANRISKHMSYQLLEEMEEWEDVHDKACMITGIIGCCFKKMYYCPIRKRNVSELVHPKNLVTNYYGTDLKSNRRYSQEVQVHGNTILSMQRLGLYSEVDLRTPEQIQDNLKNKIQGVSTPKVDATTPYNFIEQYTYLDLDDDGYEEPYICLLDLGSKKLLRVVACFSEESVTYTEDNEVQHIQQDQYFTQYGLLPAPDGSFYHYGFGQYVGPLNHALNTLFNQLIDKGTLNNRGGGFISKGIRIQGGAVKFKIGEYQTVNSTGEDLRKGIFPMPFGEPSGTLFSLATFLVGAGQRLAGTMDSQVGEDPGQNQKATTTMAVQQQGQKVFSGIYKRFLRSLKEELRILKRLNKEHLDPETYFTVLDTGESASVLIQDYYAEDLDVVPSADPTYTNEQQKLQKAITAMELADRGLADRILAGRMVAEAQELPNLEQLLKVPPPPPSIEERKFEDDSMRAWAELRLKAFELSNIKGPQARAAALKAIAEAEAVEPGRQLEAYKTVLQTLDKELDREIKQQKEANSGQTTGTGTAGEAG